MAIIIKRTKVYTNTQKSILYLKDGYNKRFLIRKRNAIIKLERLIMREKAKKEVLRKLEN